MFQLNLREKISSQICFFLKLLLTAGRIKHYQLINDMSYKATKETKNLCYGYFKKNTIKRNLKKTENFPG